MWTIGRSQRVEEKNIDLSSVKYGIDGRNMIFGHKLHIGAPYRGKRFLTRQIPTSCLLKSRGIIR